MTEDELEKRGQQVFERFSHEDKIALKWFLTGQIQNILANEHGIGGSKGVRDQVQDRADKRINDLLKDDVFMEKLAQKLADKHGSRTNYPKLINDATERAVTDYCRKAAGEAGKRIKIKVYIEPDPEDPTDEPENFAKF